MIVRVPQTIDTITRSSKDFLINCQEGLHLHLFEPGAHRLPRAAVVTRAKHPTKRTGVDRTILGGGGSK